MNRWLKILIWAGVGLALGLLYGWVVSPVQYVDITPDTLRADYKSDYVLMVAEIYQTEADPARAAARLGLLGPQTPVEHVSAALNYLRGQQAPSEDINALLHLQKGLERWAAQEQP